MKLMASIALGLVLASAGLAVSESVALAACTAPPAPPVECASGRNLRAYQAGVYTGSALVDQIWTSTAVHEDPDLWYILKQQVDTTIPGIIAGLPGWPDDYDTYVQCRAQGLLEGTTCNMDKINPGNGCALDGIDWGLISSQIYCDLSVALGGLGAIVPWFLQTPHGLCGDTFESWCGDVFRYVATNAADPLQDPEHLTPPGIVAPWPPEPDPLCAPYTQDPFDDIFGDSVTVDCEYELPPPTPPTL